MSKKKSSPFIKLKDIEKIDFNSPELRAEFEEIERRNKELLELTKPDWKAMNQIFDI